MASFGSCFASPAAAGGSSASSSSPHQATRSCQWLDCGSLRGRDAAGPQLPRAFLVENIGMGPLSQAAVSSRSLRHRKSKDLQDLDESRIAKWGSIVEGTDTTDGWIEVDLDDRKSYLPTTLEGLQIVTACDEVPAEKWQTYVADGSRLTVLPDHISYRFSRNLQMDNLYPQPGLTWGGCVDGIPDGDGWLYVRGGLYLPFELNSEPVLVACEAPAEHDGMVFGARGEGIISVLPPQGDLLYDAPDREIIYEDRFGTPIMLNVEPIETVEKPTWGDTLDKKLENVHRIARPLEWCIIVVTSCFSLALLVAGIVLLSIHAEDASFEAADTTSILTVLGALFVIGSVALPALLLVFANAMLPRVPILDAAIRQVVRLPAQIRWWLGNSIWA
eukprot:TRINITY_DN29946_c0_g1_i1.p1 TRINITY_DN29946_c0_g1~~TRINITY_DN29946_c0_g1_i1.p1  ORF type:complete len:389 (+),score=75.55 TRINITY_DN29946_c0_g1_i1:91-1257(+)